MIERENVGNRVKLNDYKKRERGKNNKREQEHNKMNERVSNKVMWEMTGRLF
jgi:hypothetical protein